MNEGVNPHGVPLAEAVERLRRTHGDDTAIVLIGSAARGLWAEANDIDLLVIVNNEGAAKAAPLSGYHLQVLPQWEFLRNLLAGEDFEAWCVRYGKPLYDSGRWDKIKQSPGASAWPKWQSKVLHGARRLFLARSLLDTKDRDAAGEETVYALGHVARGLLLKSGVFPLSRPELAQQVREAGYPHLADIHEQLRRGGDVSLQRIALAQRYAKKLLLHLDRGAYAVCAEDYRRRRREKRLRKPTR